MNLDHTLSQFRMLIAIVKANGQIQKIHMRNVFQQGLILITVHQTVYDSFPDFFKILEKLHIHISPGQSPDVHFQDLSDYIFQFRSVLQHLKKAVQINGRRYILSLSQDGHAMQEHIVVLPDFLYLHAGVLSRNLPYLYRYQFYKFV